MATISTQRVMGFLKSPRTYPRGGLGFGIDAGALSAARPSKASTTNRMFAKGTVGPMRTPTITAVTQKLKADLRVKSAEFKGKEMLEKIKTLALEKCAGNEQKALDFLTGFYDELLEKDASFGDMAGSLAKEFAGGIGKGLAGVTLGLGVAGIAAAAKDISKGTMHTQFTMALERAISTNPILRQAKKEKVINYAETIFKFAPHVATDANLLSSILANAVHGEGIDPQTIKTLTDLESRYTMTASPAAFSPKSYV